MDFELLIGTVDASSPKRRRIASRSIESFGIVPVPWPLT